MRETQVQSRGQEGPLEKGTATHSSTLAWRVPCTEELGGLQSMGWQSRTGLRDSHSLSSPAQLPGPHSVRRRTAGVRHKQAVPETMRLGTNFLETEGS